MRKKAYIKPEKGMQIKQKKPPSLTHAPKRDKFCFLILGGAVMQIEFVNFHKKNKTKISLIFS